MEHRKIKVLVFGVLVIATVVSAIWAAAFLRSDEFREIKEAQEDQELTNGRHTPVPPAFLTSPQTDDRERRSTPTPLGVSASPSASPGPTATPRITPTPAPKPTPFPKGDIPFPSPTARPRSPDRRA